MKALIPLVIALITTLALTTVRFAQRASAERERAEAAIAARDEQLDRVRDLERARHSLEQQLASLKRQIQETASAQASASSSPAARAAPEPAASARTSVRSAASPLPAPRVRWMGLNTPSASPAAQRVIRAQMKAALRRQYEGMGAALGLSPEEENKLIDVLAEQRTRGFPSPPDGKLDSARVRQAALERRQRDEAEIAAIIGQDRMPQWEEYQRSLPQRMEVNMIRDQLQTMGVPIDQNQQAQLLDILHEDNQLHPPPTLSPGLSPQDMQAQLTKWQEERDRRILERVQSVLTPEQYSRYRDYQQWQSEMRQNALRNFHVMSGSASAGAPVSVQFAVPAEVPKP